MNKWLKEQRAMQNRFRAEARKQGGCVRPRVGMAFEHTWLVSLTETIRIGRGKGIHEHLVTQEKAVELTCSGCGKVKKLP